jgi:uncharacterized membrane protein
MSEQNNNESETKREPLLPDKSQRPEDGSLAALTTNIDKKLEEARISLPPEERKRVGLVIEEVIEKSQFFSGPQPPPAMLVEYERVCPGWAEKLLQMGVDEQRHRHLCDRKELDQNDQVIALDHRDATYALTGLIFGFLVLLAILGIGAYALFLGHVNVAIACFGSGFLAAVARVFVRGRDRKQPSVVNAEVKSGQTSKPQPTRSKRKKR